MLIITIIFIILSNLIDMMICLSVADELVYISSLAGERSAIGKSLKILLQQPCSTASWRKYVALWPTALEFADFIV